MSACFKGKEGAIFANSSEIVCADCVFIWVGVGFLGVNTLRVGSLLCQAFEGFRSQKRPFVRNSVCSQFLEGLFAILAECSQFCLRSF